MKDVEHIYKTKEPALKGHSFGESTLSRMRQGETLATPCREKLILLYLTISYLAQGKPDAASQDTLYREAEKFTKTLLNLSGVWVYDTQDPHHLRAIEILGEHGRELITEACHRHDRTALRKLMVLLELADEPGAARHFAGDQDAASLPAGLTGEAAEAAYEFGRRYQAEGELTAARTYFHWAAAGNHMDAAYQAGDLAELMNNWRDARRYFLKADSLGHREGRRRAELLLPRLGKE